LSLPAPTSADASAAAAALDAPLLREYQRDAVEAREAAFARRIRGS
jgi:hypothetical protein